MALHSDVPMRSTTSQQDLRNQGRPDITLADAVAKGAWSQSFRKLRSWSVTKITLRQWLSALRREHRHTLRLIIWDETDFQIPWELFFHRDGQPGRPRLARRRFRGDSLYNGVQRDARSLVKPVAQSCATAQSWASSIPISLRRASCYPGTATSRPTACRTCSLDWRTLAGRSASSMCGVTDSWPERSARHSCWHADGPNRPVPDARAAPIPDGCSAQRLRKRSAHARRPVRRGVGA